MWKTFFPILQWLPNYKLSYLKLDFISGLNLLACVIEFVKFMHIEIRYCL